MWLMQPGKRGRLQARQRGISARSTPFFAPASILCQLPSRPPEALGPRLHHSLESWGGGSELRPESLGHYSSYCRESRWQCSTRHIQCMCMFKFSCRDNSAISTVIIHCSLALLFAILPFYFAHYCIYIHMHEIQ